VLGIDSSKNESPPAPLIMWPWLTLLAAVGAVAAHVVWRRRYQRLEVRCREQRAIDRKTAENEQWAAHMQAQQQAVFNSMVEGVLVLDGAGRIQWVNESLKKLFAVEDELTGQTILEAFRLPELAAIVRRLPAERMVQNYALELPGMEERWLQVNAASVVGRTGAPAGAILVVHDLTRIKQLESTRQEFVANVSHELRTPLSLIKGYVETLLEGAKDDPEKCSRFLQTIEKHTDRLTFLIEDLLTISRLESGRIVMNRQAVELREEAAHVVEDLRARATEKNVTLENNIPAGLTASADAERLEQVLYNLVENAIKYGRAEGAVRIGARALEDRPMVEMWVSDNGPGIPADARDRVFERFYRVDRARSRESGGTGLGLSIVKHIVQAHGGEVWVHSELGEGASFHFTLPVE
jgi:two-component system phosphate regulon sensor histidine kinase PhoR